MLWMTAAALPSASTAQLNVVSPAARGTTSAGAGPAPPPPRAARSAEPRGALGEVGRVERALERDVPGRGVAEIPVAVLEGERGRADDRVDVARGVSGQRRDVDVLEHPEDLQPHEALRVRRRRDDAAAAIRGPCGLDPVAAMRGEVV